DRDGIITPQDEDPLNAELPHTADDAELEMMRSNSTWTTTEHNGFGTTVDSGGSFNCAIMANGSVACWGDDGSAPDNYGPYITSLPSGRTAVSLSVGGTHTCAVLDDGSAACWGDNSYGQLADGSIDTSWYTPVYADLPDDSSAVSVSTGSDFTCFLLENGTVACWGNNNQGQLGNGTTESADGLPGFVAFPFSRSAISISSGASHTCAILDNASVACWGDNEFGKLGDGTTTDSSEPVGVSLPSGSPAVSISAGYDHTCAVLDNGSAMCWGSNGEGTNGYGQLGDGTVLDSSTPVQVGISDGRNAVAVSVGKYYSCAVLTDGSAVCWGRGVDGQ
ncbi:MAG: hypothetical protein VX686_03810, partial [Candidatus Thermoplasmatota archaeon]|nr:hypothetical protein [Candidatus Thermoplasmatota archaeon]